MITLEFTNEELKALLFAVNSDLDTVLQMPDEWSIGEIMTLSILQTKLSKAVKDDTNIRRSG